jgi:hypothetical protein
VPAEPSKHSVTYVDASAWIADKEFEDAVHVGARGAVDFTRRLAASPELRSDRDRGVR